VSLLEFCWFLFGDGDFCDDFEFGDDGDGDCVDGAADIMHDVDNSNDIDKSSPNTVTKTN